jgi:hypothetical protein
VGRLRTRFSKSGFWLRSSRLEAHVPSPAATRSLTQSVPPTALSASRARIHCWVKPALKIPPGQASSHGSAITDSGVTAARCGGLVAATYSWVMPE